MAFELDVAAVPSPAFVIDVRAVLRNVEQLHALRARTGVRVLLAQKAFAAWRMYPQMAPYLDGVCASGLYEARLGRLFGKQVHTYAPAFRPDEMEEIAALSDHVVFNSPTQLAALGPVARRSGCQVGLRVNPRCSQVPQAIYDPCAPKSRLGTVAALVDEAVIAQVDGLHFHVLCEQGLAELRVAVDAFERQFSRWFGDISWVNWGGGHNMNRPGYDIDGFCALVAAFRDRYPHLEVFIEPGGAAAFDAGVLVCTVLDVVENDGLVAVLDVSCTAHTPDVLEMPYRPAVRGEVPLDQAPYRYRLGGVSCLAGDVFGDYGFAHPLRPGDRIVFEDMAHYTMVKTTMFNGVRHPSIVAFDALTGDLETWRTFSFEDFKNRLG